MKPESTERWQLKIEKLPKDTRTKRLIRHMTNPPRLVFGIPVAYLLAWINYGHHVTEGTFWAAYGAWIIATFILFWLYELHAWAGGKSKLD